MISRLFRRGRSPRIELSVASPAVRRGERIEATVTVADVDGVDVGLVCTARWVSPSGSRTREGLEYEAWERVATSSGRAAVSLPVPADAPFSYDGEALSFRWTVNARPGGDSGVVVTVRP